MSKYLFALLGVAVLVLGSFLYKESRSRILTEFPRVADRSGEPQHAPVLHLYLFFNSENCKDCLNLIDVLNDLPPQYSVTGLVPQRDFNNQEGLRVSTGAKFDLKCSDPLRRYLPHYAPTLYGTTGNGKVLFVLPAVPGESSYFMAFLDSFYRRAYQLILE